MPASPEWVRLIGSQLWQITLLIPAVILLARLACRQRSHLAYGLLLVVLVKCLTPPIFFSPLGLFSWVEGRSQEPWQPVTDSEPVRAVADQRALNGAAPTVSHFAPADDAAQTAGAERTAASGPSASPDAGPVAVSPPAQPTNRRRSLAAALAAVGAAVRRHGFAVAAALWLAGTLAFSAYLLWSIARLRGLCRQADEAPEPISRLADGLARQWGLQPPPELRVTDDATMPVAAGLRRRTVLLPRYLLESATDDELELILAHELNHFRRRDTLVGALQVAAQVLYWFHPCVWWLNRELRRYREHCCDEEVLARLGCRPQQYARCLLNVLELNERCSPALALAGMSPFEMTSRRLRNIMRDPASFRSHTPAWCWCVVLAAGALLLPGASAPVRQGARNQGASLTRELPPGEVPAAAATDQRPSAPSTAAAAAPIPEALHYNWRPGMTLPYRINIEIDHNNEVETISGTPSFHVRSASNGQAELFVTGDRLLSVHAPKPGRIGDLSMPRVPRFPRVAFPGPGFPTEHTVRIDSRGRVISEQGASEPLPYLLGHLASFLFEPLPETLRNEWRQTRTTEIRFSTDDSDDSPFPIRRTSPFSPFAEPEPELLSAEETATYRVEVVDAAHVALHKSCTLATVQTVDGEPRVQWTGQVRITFDADRGLPTAVSCDARMTQKDGNVTTTWPIRATAELVESTSAPPEDASPPAANSETLPND